MPGDFVIEGRGVRAVVGGPDRKPELRGAVLELLRRGMSPFDGLTLLSQSLYLRGTPERIRVLGMRIIARRGTPVLRIDGLVQQGEHVLEVAREVGVAAMGEALVIATRIASHKPEHDVRMGEKIAWGAAQLHLPRLGMLADERFHTADWVGSEGATGSIVIGMHRGALSLRASYEQRDGQPLLEHTELVESEHVDLAAKKPHYEKLVIVLGDRGVGGGVRRLGFYRQMPLPEVWVTLPYHPEGSEVRLLDERARPLLSARPDDQGRAVLPLMAADEYTAIASAYGHAESDPVRWKASARPASLELVIPRGGRIRLRARDAADGSWLPVRMRLLPLGQTGLLRLGPDHRAAGAGDTVLALSGDADVAVPSGRYRVLLTHGPEWSLHQAEVMVSETWSPRIDAKLVRLIDPGPWVACDLHVHAAPSPDSEVTLEDRLVSLRAEGIRFAAATDHNHVTDYSHDLEHLHLGELQSVSGVEVTTDAPAFGHFNAYPYPLDPTLPNNGAPEATASEPAKLFAALHALDPSLVVQVNHSRSEGGIGYFEVMGFDAEHGSAVDPRWSSDFDALEVWNGFDLARPDTTERVFQDWLALLQRGKRVVATGSSDSHQIRYQLAGYPRTYARVESAEPPEPRAIVAAIKAGASFVSSGPFLDASIAGTGPGGTVSAHEGHVELTVRARVPDFMTVERLEVFVGSERVIDRAFITAPERRKRKPMSAPVAHHAEARVTLPVTQDTFVVVRVSSPRPLDLFFGRANIPPMAFTNPIFVDADGDAQTPWTPATAAAGPSEAPTGATPAPPESLTVPPAAPQP